MCRKFFLLGVAWLVMLMFVVSGCKIDTDVDDAAEIIADTADEISDNNSSGSSSSPTDQGAGSGSSSGSSSSSGTSNNNSPDFDISDDGSDDSADDAEDDAQKLNGVVWMDPSLKATERFLMGTYYRDWSSSANPWLPPVVVRAYSRIDGKIDFEDVDGNLLWIADIATAGKFKYTADVNVNSVSPLKTNCTCQPGSGWQCSCDFTGSAVTYSYDLARMGLDADDVYDDEGYAGITDQKNYFSDNWSTSCEYNYAYDVPNNLTANFLGRRIDFVSNADALLWSADLHEDETFDFTIGGYPDAYGLPTVNLKCGCQFVSYTGYSKSYDTLEKNDLSCHCESSEGVKNCAINYKQQ
ncbi:MAG: hypothetical protein HQM16_06520 [Deltaproteobacteria bacterium]|nr:hypothetical protein [Deltaproteobacteria bacterium]